MTGTDEHGAKIVEAAEANATTPREWTDRTSARFVETWSGLEIANDDFIRTTEARHYAVVQEFLQRIYDNGYIELAPYTGLYCISKRLLHRGPAGRREVPRARPSGGGDAGGQLLLQVELQLKQAAARPLRQPPEFRAPGLEAQRGARLHSRRPPRRVDHTDLVHVGRTRALGQRSRVLRVVRRPHQLPDRGRLRR